MLAAVSILIALFRIPVRIFTALLGTRGETIGHLLLSVIKYGGTLGTFFYCLYLIGIDSSSLIASAGILSLVIGLGAQSLIKDIIAGIFIVFEGEFRVGDIVTIGNYRGTVMDIGLRTTKILGGDGNIKIYNNSEISGILNMTQEASIAQCEVGIEYGQDIDYVEAVLEKELPEISKANRDILEGPTYQGVQLLGDSGVRLLITCKCSERNIKSVERYLNRSILQIFYRNKINIPFPNVTFSMLNEDSRMTMDDFLAGHRKADDFPGD
jgi:small conductance mechanosensitive channel